MALQDARAGALADLDQARRRRCQTSLDRCGERDDIPCRNEPAIFALANELGNTADERADHRTSQRHRLHDDDRQPLGEARQDECARGRHLVAHLRAVDPAGDADPVAKTERADQRFDLVLAGDGELRGAIEERIRALDLAPHVRITGWIASAAVRSEIEAARALVLPSFAEGLPVVIMEAMALRRAVVTTFVAGIPELVRDGENGWLVPAGDVDALADAIVASLAADGDALARMGSAGRERVLARHDVDVEAGKLARLFVAQPGGAAP